ncbi:recombinase family protein [Aliterella atlantica]|uniref:Recombinase n=1 Tax=Aliterella atlantica CENA595 TaxID=1618023 RepID=A0A0D8ZRP1_9CYAN|nr:recombinase family protein [Aliterella atlantica]KJH71395.1 recombinase [Aliterella atlantica CENA595]
MKIIAYTYTNPLLEPPPDPNIWGWEPDKTYQDIGKRTQLQQLLKAAQTDTPDYLLISRLDQLGDTIAEITNRLLLLESLNIKIIATEQTTPKADILQLLQQIQYQQRSSSIRQGHARNRINALTPPGKTPYGYRRIRNRYAIDRTTAPVVKDFFEQFLLYGSLRGAVRYLAQKYAKKISVTTGRRWLTNPVYRGDTAYQDGQILIDTHTPIISREEAAQVDRLLYRNRRLPPRTASANRSLAGLVVCRSCQSPMTVVSVTKPRKTDEYLYLRPTACPHLPKCKAIAYQEVLQQTIATICHDLPLAVAGKNLPQLDAVKNSYEQAIARQQEILDQLPDLVENGILDAETSALRAYKLRSEISEVQAQLATLPPVNLRSVAQALSIPQFWLDLSEFERRFYFREFIRQIELLRQDETWQLQVMFIF